jgi:hypothetical protein
MKKCGIVDYVKNSVIADFHLACNARFVKVFTWLGWRGGAKVEPFKG